MGDDAPSDGTNASSELTRLKRRVERERAARLAAESEAEKGLSALYQAQREADLMRAIATAANQAEFVGQALGICLLRMCDYAAAAAGTAWLCPEESGVLVATGIWQLSDGSRFATLRGLTDATWLRRGEGLPGRVLETGKPAWVVDVSEDRALSRHLSSAEIGVRAAFAMPVLIGSTVAGVLEFFFEEAKPEDERLLALAGDIGEQLGRVIERHSANVALARTRDELETRVRERTADIERVNSELRREIAERDAADAANRAKSEFLANMSHEIRTPMTSVLGYADLLMDAELSPSERVNYLQTIRRNGEHLLSILNDILDLSKIEAGKMTVESVECSPSQILADVASLMRVRALEKRVELQIEFATPVPEKVKSDPTRLRQILMNLVGNAIKFTEKGCVRVVVRAEEVVGVGPKLSFTVIDEGIGMSTPQVERLFRPFSQADSSTTRKFGGTGLGLVICKRLADMLGGTITVESQVGRGSTFTLTIQTGLLINVRMLVGLQESLASPVLRAAPAPKLDGRILLAEDGHDNQLLLSAHLTKAGAEVEIAENGRIAVEKALAAQAAGRSFDVILMDMQMPELDGYSATSKLRASGYQRPIVALTAHAMSTDRERCLLAGCDEYLTKPVDRNRLLSTVQHFIGIARANPERVDGAPAPASRPGSMLEPLFSTLEDDGEMVPLIARFVATLDERAAALRSAVAQGDVATLERIAHQLKGAAGGYGFDSIGRVAGELEAAIREGAARDEIKSRIEVLAGFCGRAQMRRALVALAPAAGAAPKSVRIR